MSKSRHRKSAVLARTDNELRIIGGQWRGRKLQFPGIPGLRPTPDRVRETLFNWLAAVIPGARCLDLFAGSGALGLEALSRGAASVTLVDSSRTVADQLRKHLVQLQADAEVVHQSADRWLQSMPRQRYDAVFLDPPFAKGLAQASIDQMVAAGILCDRAWVYVEMGCDEPIPTVPPNWLLYRDKRAGQVCYRLFQVQPPV